MKNSKRDYHIQVSIPSGDKWEAEFGNSVASLMYVAAHRRFTDNTGEQRVSLVNVRSSLLPQSREDLLKGAIESGCTHVLFLDSDMKFPKETLHHLLQQNKQVIGANYVRKCIPALPVACGLDKKICFADANKPDLEPVLHTGFGVMLIDLEVMKDIPQPWFQIMWSEELQCYTGEDSYFFNLLHEAGVPVYVDNVLSHEVAHIGPFAYDHQVVGVSMTEEEYENANSQDKGSEDE